MEKEFKKLNSNNYFSGEKGDFSKLEKADLIISIGWQTTALKAASMFKKPFLFYSKLEFPYDDNIFSLDKKRNLEIKKYSKRLWLNEKNFVFRINKIFKEKKELMVFKNDSSKLLKEIGFYGNKIDEYFAEYFK